MIGQYLGRLAWLIAFVAAISGVVLVAWLWWSADDAVPEAQQRWTVLESNPDAVRYIPGKRKGNSTPLEFPRHIEPGDTLEPGQVVVNRGSTEVRLRTPGGDVLVFEPESPSAHTLRHHVSTPTERIRAAWASHAHAIRSAWEESMLMWRLYTPLAGMEAALVVALSIVWLAWRPRWQAITATEPLRHNVAGAIAIIVLGGFALLQLFRGISNLGFMGGVLEARSSRPEEIWASVHAVTGPVATALYVAGLISVTVLAATLFRQGKAALHRRTWPWWAATVGLALLVVMGMGARFLPFVDLHSNTEAYFRRFEIYASQGAGALFWLCVVLLIERGIPLAPEPEASAGVRRPGATWAVAIMLLCCLGVAKAARDWHAAVPPEGGPSEAWLQFHEGRYCRASEVVVGQARDFHVVRESGCVPHLDGRHRPLAGVLQHCEALEFKVDVLEQLWPLPAGRESATGVRTFRLTGVSARVEDLQRELMLGKPTYDANLRETTGPGPRVFYAGRGGDESPGLLRNTHRGVMVTEPAPRDEPREARSRNQICGRLPALADGVRQACRWDVAFIATARAVPQPAEGSPANGTAMGLEVVSDLDPARPTPRRLWRLDIGAGQHFDGSFESAWLERDGKPRQYVVLARVDPAVPDQLRLLPRNEGEPPQALSRNPLKEQLAEARQDLRECFNARTAWNEAQATPR